eukprot:3847190-Amphidinium_carterae.1
MTTEERVQGGLWSRGSGAGLTIESSSNKPCHNSSIADIVSKVSCWPADQHRHPCVQHHPLSRTR